MLPLWLQLPLYSVSCNNTEIILYLYIYLSTLYIVFWDLFLNDSCETFIPHIGQAPKPTDPWIPQCRSTVFFHRFIKTQANLKDNVKQHFRLYSFCIIHSASFLSSSPGLFVIHSIPSPHSFTCSLFLHACSLPQLNTPFCLLTHRQPHTHLDTVCSCWCISGVKPPVYENTRLSSSAFSQLCSAPAVWTILSLLNTQIEALQMVCNRLMETLTLTNLFCSLSFTGPHNNKKCQHLASPWMKH